MGAPQGYVVGEAHDTAASGRQGTSVVNGQALSTAHTEDMAVNEESQALITMTVAPEELQMWQRFKESQVMNTAGMTPGRPGLPLSNLREGKVEGEESSSSHTVARRSAQSW